MKATAELHDAAYRAWELKEYFEAASLFEAAAQGGVGSGRVALPLGCPGRKHSVDCGQGFCLWEGGNDVDAKPLLERVIRFDWKGGRLWGDRRDSDKAYCYLLGSLANSGSRDEFIRTWRNACERGREIDIRFPFSRPCKRLMILASIKVGYPEGCAAILGICEESDYQDFEPKLALELATQFVGSTNFFPPSTPTAGKSAKPCLWKRMRSILGFGK